MSKGTRSASTGLRVDVTYLKPNGYHEFGLVDYPPDSEPTTPTLFIGAYCKTADDVRWLKAAVDAIVRRSKLPDPQPPPKPRKTRT